MNRKLTTLIGSLALISGAAFAQTSTDQSSGASSRQDTGMGGATSQSPSQSDSMSQGFSSLDKNSDGQISRREAASQQSLSRVFDQADENKDGQLSQSEYQGALSEDTSSVN